jgi:hypothetical protein
LTPDAQNDAALDLIGSLASAPALLIDAIRMLQDRAREVDPVTDGCPPIGSIDPK